MDNSIIEQISTTAVKDFFLKKSKQIQPNVNDGDKGISFDGNLSFYSSEKRTKESYSSSIKIQVKGTEVGKFDKVDTKFSSFGVEEYKNFQLEDGIIVFRVQVLTKDSSTKIFYKFLSTTELEEIMSEMREKNLKTKTLKLDYLDPTSNIDELFKDIFIKKTSNPLVLEKVKRQFLGENSFQDNTSEIQIKAIEEVKKDFDLMEYRNPDSEFNKDLIINLKKLLTTFIMDNLSLALLQSKSFQRDEVFRNLPNQTKNLLLLANARYFITQNDISKVDEFLAKIKVSSETRGFYEKIEIENLISKSALNLIEWQHGSERIVASHLTDDEKKKYLALLYTTVRKHNEAEKLLSDADEFNYDWKFVKAIYFSDSFQYAKAAENYLEIYNRYHYPEIKLRELALRFTDYFYSDSTKDISELYSLLKEIGELETELKTYKNITLLGVASLKIKIETLIEPEKGVTILEQKIAEEKNPDDVEELKIWKAQLLIILKEFSQAKKILDDVDNIKSQILKIQMFQEQKDSESLIEFIEKAITKVWQEDIGFNNFLLDTFLRIPNMEDILDASKLEEKLSIFGSHFDFEIYNLLLVEILRKKLKSKSYGEYKGAILEKLSDSENEYSLKMLGNLLVSLNDIDYFECLFPSLKKINYGITREIYITILYNNNQPQKVIQLLDEIPLNNLSLSMLQIKANTYNQLEQYNGTVWLYTQNRIDDLAFLDAVLIAKLNLGDKKDIEILINRLIESQFERYEIDAALALIRFQMDVIKGMQIIEKYILRYKIRDNILNGNFLGCILDKRIEKLDFDRIGNKELSYLRFITSDSKLEEYLLVPEEWGVDDFDEYRIQGLNSDLQLQVYNLNVNQKINIDGKELTFVDKNKLSTFLAQKIFSSENPPGIIKKISFSEKNVEPDVSELLNFLEKISEEDNKRKEQALFVYNQYHYPSIFEKVVSPENTLEHQRALINDLKTRYYIGRATPFDENNDYQVTLSSLVFLQELGLISLIDRYNNLYIEETQLNWLEEYQSKEREETMDARIYSANGQTSLYEKTPDEVQEFNRKLTELLLVARKIKQNTVGIIQNDINKISSISKTSIQGSVDYRHVLFIEDEMLQSVLPLMHPISVSSIGSLISYHFLYKQPDVNKLLDILISVQNLNDYWIVYEPDYLRLEQLVKIENDQDISDKFDIWSKKYFELLPNSVLFPDSQN